MYHHTRRHGFGRVVSRLSTAAVLAAGFFIFACQGDWSPTSPEERQAPKPTQFIEPSGSTGSSAGVTPTSSPGDLEACGLAVKPAASHATMDGGGKVTASVGADYNSEGSVVIWLWDPEVNDGEVYGPFPANAEFSFTVPIVKDYRFRIAGEVDKDGDNHADDGCQDDRFYLTVKAPSSPPPPPPPPPPPSCQPSELDARAAEACGELGIKSIDYESCSYTCNTEEPDPCEGVSFEPGSLTVNDLEACVDIGVAPNTASWSLAWGDGSDASGDGDATDVCNTYAKAATWQAFLALFAPGPNSPKCDERPFQITTTCPSNTLEQNDGTCKPICAPPVIGFAQNGDSCIPYCEVYPDADVCQPPPPCEDPEPPAEGIYTLTTGSANTECKQLGPFFGIEKEESWPWDLEDGLFYLIKCGTQYELTHEKPSRLGNNCSLETLPGPKIHKRSHISVCDFKCPVPPVN